MKSLILVSVKIKIKSITTLNKRNITHNNFLTNQQICLVSAQQDHEVCDGNAYRVVYAPFPIPPPPRLIITWESEMLWSGTGLLSL